MPSSVVAWPFVGFTTIYAALVLALCVIVAPFDGMDEPAHFLRVTSIANGYLMPIPSPRPDPRGWPSRGGRVDHAAVKLARSLDVGERFKPPHVTLGTLHRHLAVPRAGRTVYAWHSNTAIYSPIVYAPQAAAVALADSVGAPPFAWLYVARFTGALAFCALLLAAMLTCREMAPALALAAVLPIMPFQAAVVTSDTVVLGASLVMAACVGAIIRNGRLGRARGALLIGSTVVVCSGKIAYLGLAGVPLVVGFFYGDRATRRYALTAAASAMIAFATWTLTIRHDVVPVRFDIRADPALQLRWMFGHPMVAIQVIVTSAIRDFPTLLVSMAGRLLGHDDVMVPLKALLPLLAMVLASIVAAAAVRRNLPALIAMTAIFLTSYLAITAMLYMQWTVVGAPSVSGVQGRYLLPFLFVFLALPHGRPAWPEARRLLPPVAVVAALPLWEAYRCYWL